MNKKANNNTSNKTISVNKQIQYKKKNISKNNHNESIYFNSYNGISIFKSPYNNNAINNINKITKISKNQYNTNNNTNPKNSRISNNYSNNKLRRKMILSVDMNNSKKSGKNISQFDLNNNIKLITDIQPENKNTENFSNTNSSLNNNNISNPMSNGAKSNNNNMNNTIQKHKAISVNHNMIKNRSNNNLITSPNKKYGNNVLTKYIEISDKKEKNNKNNLNKKININIKQPLKLFDQNSSINLINSGNYKVNFTTSNNDKKYIKPNIKNSGTNVYKLNNYNNNNNSNNHNSKYNIYENANNNNNTNNYKIIKEVMDIQLDMEKHLKENITNSKTKKYNTLKHSFEILIKFLGNSFFKNNNYNIINILLEKIMIGYHEVFTAFSLENRKLKQINYNLNEQYEKISKDLFNNNKILKEKQKNIDTLQKRISLLESSINKKSIQNSKKNLNINNINNKINKNIYDKNIKFNSNDEQNKKIYELNKKNLEDLDALYFFDKIKENKVNKKRFASIPKILLKKLEEQKEIEEEDEEEEYEIEENNRTVIFDDICGFFISLGDIRFTSAYFNKIRNAFIL